ncbi:hypothetical protein QTP88_023417 [Uroleucon formosanum]
MSMDASDVLVRFVGPWYAMDSFCGNSDRWPSAYSRSVVRRWSCSISPWYVDAKYRMNSLRAEDNVKTMLLLTAAATASIAAAATAATAAAMMLLYQNAVNAAAALYFPGTTAACAEHDGIPFPVTTIVVAADRTATRRAHWWQGKQPFIYTSPDPSMTCPAIAMFPVALLKSKTVFMIPR